jgi:hypothetical protein
MPIVPDTAGALVLRTDFSDDAAFAAVRAACGTTSPEGFGTVAGRAVVALTACGVTEAAAPGAMEI